MARLTLDEVLASVSDSDDDSDNFAHLDSKSEEKEDGVSAYTCQQQFGLGKLVVLCQLVCSSSSRHVYCSFLILLVPWRNRMTLLVNECYKYIIKHVKNGNSTAIISRELSG